jgi:alkylation response protein AidB-like acyl-CoA dehydrogenase
MQNGLADMVMAVEMMGPLLDTTAREWSEGVDHGANWLIKIVGTKHIVVEAAWKVVDTALDLAGGYGIFKANEIERLFRDARLGRIHPGNAALSHELIGKATLGINPDETPRWG